MIHSGTIRNSIRNLFPGYFLLGCGLYSIIITLIFYRLIFFPVSNGETGHSYWINTGAAAISVVSGLTLSEKIGSSVYYVEFLPFIRGMTLLLWITGTWWIPAIIILEIWRYFVKRVPPQYNPVQWSMVFVIGMYSLATLLTGRSFDIPFLQPVSGIFLYLGLLLWAVIFA